MELNVDGIVVYFTESDAEVISVPLVPLLDGGSDIKGIFTLLVFCDTIIK